MKTLILFGGLVHFAILTASAITPLVLDWRRYLAPLPRLFRQMFWVYGSFIVLVIVSFGAISVANADALGSGDPLARSVCGMIALFWSARLGVQWCVFDATPFLTSTLLKLGYQMLTLAFITLTIIYGCAAIHPLHLPIP